MTAPSSRSSLPRPPKKLRGASVLRFTRPSRSTVTTAAIAVGCLLVVKFAVAFVLLLGNAVDYDPSFYSNGFLESPVGLFLGSLVLYPFPFYLAAFAALAAVLPIVAESQLSTIVRRALLAGASATVVLALVGIVTGITKAVAAGDPVVILLWVVFIPVAAGVQLTAVLVGGAVIAWLWASHQQPAGDLSVEVAEASLPAGIDAVTEAAGSRPPEVQEATPSEGSAQHEPEPRATPPISIYAPPDERPGANPD